MKRLKRVVCILLFLAVGVAALLFLRAFAQSGESIHYLDWSGARVVSADGGETAFDPLSAPLDLEEGEFYRFTAVLPEREEEEYLVFEVTGLELALFLDGRELYFSSSALPEGAVNLGQLQLPLPAGAGETLTVDCRVLEPGASLFPPLVRLTRDPRDTQGAMAAANHYGIPAGASALVWLLAWGLFLLGLLYGQPDWSMLPLSLAAALLTLYYPTLEGGWYFLPEAVCSVLAWSGIPWCSCENDTSTNAPSDKPVSLDTVSWLLSVPCAPTGRQARSSTAASSLPSCLFIGAPPFWVL